LADKHIYVDKDATGLNNGTSWANAYTSLDAAEQAEEADITGAGVYYFHCKSKSGTADTADPDFAGWTTDATHYIVVQGGYAAGETGTPGTPETFHQYSTSYYHLETTNSGFPIDADADYIRFDRILFKSIQSGTNTCRGFYSVSGKKDFRLSNSIIVGESSDAGANRGCMLYADNTYLWNNIFYGFLQGADADYSGIYVGAGTAAIWNCTVHGCYSGVARGGGGGTCNIVNCAIFGNTDDLTGTINSLTYSCGDDADFGSGTGNFQITQTADDYAALVMDATGHDYRPTNSSSELVGTGDDDPGGAIQDDTDMLGVTWSSPWGIGAIQVAAGGGGEFSFPLLGSAGLLSVFRGGNL